MVRLAQDDAGEAEWLSFAAWLDAAPTDQPDLHRKAFDRAQQVWLLADGLSSVSAPAREVRPHRRPRPRARRLEWDLAAAAALALVVMGVWFGAQPKRIFVPAPRTAIYATRAGERRVVDLSDGTRVALDGATTMSVGEMTATRRSVTLVRGEAAFDVVHEPARPFTVDFGAGQVRVLGTAFDVVRDPGFSEVSVARGLVALDTPGQSVRLPAGRSATLTEGVLAVRLIAASDVDDWRTGRRTYWDAPLGAVVDDLNRGYAQPLQLGDTGARSLRFTGVLARGTRAQTVRRLTALLPLRATPKPDGVIVLVSTRH